MEDLSTGLTIEDDRSVLSLPSSAKTREESTDRKAEDSPGLEWTSQYSYCEEQCLYCLKMFAVSVLVEHACDCASRQEVSFIPAFSVTCIGDLQIDVSFLIHLSCY